jgi:hypothetical protein
MDEAADADRISAAVEAEVESLSLERMPNRTKDAPLTVGPSSYLSVDSSS